MPVLRKRPVFYHKEPVGFQADHHCDDLQVGKVYTQNEPDVKGIVAGMVNLRLFFDLDTAFDEFNQLLLLYKTPWQGDPRVNIQEGKDGKAKVYQVRQMLEAIAKLDSLV